MTRLGIRVMASREIGFGHYYRCLALASALSIVDRSIDIIFFINKELEPIITREKIKYKVVEASDLSFIDLYDIDLLILDSYLFNDGYLVSIKSKTRLMLIDDNNDIYDSSLPDIIYNGNIFAKDLGYKEYPGQKLYLGIDYLITRKEYWNSKKDTEGEEGKGLLITTGGSDNNRVGIKILDSLVKYEKTNKYQIKYIIGPGYGEGYIKELETYKKYGIIFIYRPRSLREFILSSKLIITSVGSTVYEVMLEDKPMLIYSVAKNQEKLYDYLSIRGIETLGKYPKIDYNVFKNLSYVDKQKIRLDRNSTINLAKKILSEFSIDRYTD